MGAEQMPIVDHDRQPPEQWRAGVTTRMRVSAVTGTMQLCLFEQFCDDQHEVRRRWLPPRQ